MTSIAFPSTVARGAADARAIAYWLLACAAMVLAMAVIGAVTRLTESGLSMVEWKPLMGAIPPLSEAEWQRVFGLYRQTPEYRLENAGMDLAGFKTIFFWEWFHRLWGRLIGVVFAVPLVWFWATGRLGRADVDGTLGWKLIGLLVLGGLQGALGWYMVMSGLVDRPSVSHYRLAAHLGAACLIYALLLWVAFDLLWPRRSLPLPPGERAGVRGNGPCRNPDAASIGTTPSPDLSPGGRGETGLRLHAWAVLGLVSVTMVWGAFVAGLDAGFAYNTFPLMDGAVLPQEAWTIEPAWLNLFDNTALVQFVHRWLAIATAGTALLLSWRALRAGLAGRAKAAAAGVAGAVVVQVALGVSTLLFIVPVALAAAHQAGALLLLALVLLFIHETGRTRGAMKIP